MIESEIKNFFYRNGYRPEIGGYHEYKGRGYDCFVFSDGYSENDIICAYLSEAEILIGYSKHKNISLDNLKKIKSTEENLRSFLDRLKIEELPDADVTEILAEIKARRGQNIYREGLMKLWNGKCALTGISMPELLVGSHAKAWQYSNNKERLDVYNGFLFEARIDKLFDKYLISFEDNGRILISSRLDDTERRKLGLNSDMHIDGICPRHIEYLKFHREKFYQNEINKGGSE